MSAWYFALGLLLIGDFCWEWSDADRNLCIAVLAIGFVLDGLDNIARAIRGGAP